MILQRRLANKYYAKAIEHAMQGYGYSYAFFSDPTGARAPNENEELFWREISDLPQKYKDSANGRKLRACVKEKGTGKTRFLVNWSRPRRELFHWLDMHSVGWNIQFWLYPRQKIRGWFNCDPAHRRNNNFNNSVSAQKMKHLEQEAILVLNIGNAPWSGCGHFGKYQEAGEEFFSNFSAQQGLWQISYPLLCEFLWPGRRVLGFGEDWHMQWLFEKARDDGIFHFKQLVVKSNRWFQTWRRWVKISSRLDFLLVVIVYVGLHLSWWPCIEQSPIASSLRDLDNDGEDEAAEMLAEPGGEDRLSLGSSVPPPSPR